METSPARELEDKVLSIVRFRRNYNRYSSILEGKFFQTEESRALYSLITKFFSHYKEERVKLKTLSFLVAEQIPNSTRNTCLELVSRLKGLRVRDEDAIRDIVLRFSQKQKLKQMIMEAVPLLDSGNLDLLKIKRRLDEAIELEGKGKIEEYLDYFKSPLQERVQDLLNEWKCATLIGKVDDYIRGGVAKGELGIVLAPQNVGKTLALVNLAVSALVQGLRVLHVSMEISSRKVGERYDIRISGRTLKNLGEYPSRGKKIIEALQKRGGRLFIKDFSDRAPTVLEFDALCEQVESTFPGEGPLDMLIIDYADLMSPAFHREERRFELTEIYTDLRRLGQKRNLLIWTASQVRRKAMAGFKIRLDDFGEDIQKASIADIVLTISQTEGEADENVARLYIAKNRRDWRKPTFRMALEPKRQFIGELE